MHWHYHIVLLMHVAMKSQHIFVYRAITVKKTEMPNYKLEKKPTLRNVQWRNECDNQPRSPESPVPFLKILNMLVLEISLYSPPVFCNPSQRMRQEACLTSPYLHSRFIMEVFWHHTAHWPCLSPAESSCLL